MKSLVKRHGVMIDVFSPQCCWRVSHDVRVNRHASGSISAEFPTKKTQCCSKIKFLEYTSQGQRSVKQAKSVIKWWKKNVEQLWICLELTDLPDIEDVEEWPSRGLQKLWRLQNQKWHGEGRAVGDSFGNPLCDRNWETHKKGRMDEAKSRKIQ